MLPELKVSTHDFQVFCLNQFSYQDIPLLNLELHPAQNGVPDYYALNWTNQLNMRDGIFSIKESYRVLKERYMEPRGLIGVEKEFPFGKAQQEILGLVFCRGPVQFNLKDHESMMAVGMETFLQPGSFLGSSDLDSPLGWIRVNTEYVEYYLDCASGKTGIAGGIGFERPPKEFFSDFYRPVKDISMDDSLLDAMYQKTEELLEHLPSLSPR